MPSNYDKGVETSNLFEYLQDEETNEEKVETIFPRDDNNSNRTEGKKTNHKSGKKGKNMNPKSKDKRRNKEVKKQTPIKMKKSTSDIVVKRCHGCHVDHFPLPKFCRWWEKKISLRKVTMKRPEQMNVETNFLVNRCIEILEDKLKGSTVNELLVNDFFERSEDSCKPEEFQDLFNLKLRGGGNKKHRVGIKSNNNTLDSVLSFFRDMTPLWDEIESHPLCDHHLEPNCFYCLLRSLSLRSMNPQVRTPISPFEILSCLEEKNIDKLKINYMIKSVIELLSISVERVSKMLRNISIFCEKCGKDDVVNQVLYK